MSREQIMKTSTTEKVLTKTQSLRLLRSLARGFQDGETVDLDTLVACVKGIETPATLIDARRLVRALYSVGVALRQLNHFEQAIFVLQNGLEIVESFELEYWKRKLVGVLVWTYVDANQKDRAIEFIRDLLRQAPAKRGYFERKLIALLDEVKESSRRASLPERVDMEHVDVARMLQEKSSTMSKKVRKNMLGWD